MNDSTAKRERIERIAALYNTRHCLKADFFTEEALTETLTAALTALCEEMEREKWLPIVDAPVDGTEVRLLLKSGRTLTASMLWGFVDSNNRDCACWVCSDENECPECWTDGACWQVNADGNPSDQPTHCQPLPQPPET